MGEKRCPEHFVEGFMLSEGRVDISPAGPTDIKSSVHFEQPVRADLQSVKTSVKEERTYSPFEYKYASIRNNS